MTRMINLSNYFLIIMCAIRNFTVQGGHGTGKTGNLAVNFSRQENTGNLVNLIFYTGKIVATQGKY